jgi:hypothetical protein
VGILCNGFRTLKREIPRRSEAILLTIKLQPR